MDTNTQTSRFTLTQFAERHSEIDLDQLVGFVRHKTIELHLHGAISFRSAESPIILIDEHKFFSFLLNFPVTFSKDGDETVE